MTLTNRIALGVCLLIASATLGWAQQYVISTVGGDGPPLPTPIVGVKASIGAPSSVATDSVGNTYFSALDYVFKLDLNGVITRVAGNSGRGYSGDGGPSHQRATL